MNQTIMKGFIAFIFILTCFFSSTFSQTDFKRGYIVKLNGDTLHGYINFRKEVKNYSECNFKRFQIAFPVNYAPDKIKGYGIHGEKQYLSATLNGKNVFVEYLVKGNLSLLYYKKGTQHFYIKDAEGNIVELETGKMIDSKSNRTYNHYKEYLTNKMNLVSINDEIHDSKLEITSLTSLVKQYNELINSAYEVPQRPNDKSILKDYSILNTNELKFGIMGGINYFQYSFSSSSQYEYMGRANFKPITNPVFGLFIKGRISRNLPNFYFQGEALFHKVSLYGFSDYNLNSYSKDMTYNDIYINYKNLGIHGTIKYSINLGKIKILPHIGLGYTLFMNSSYSRFNQIYSSFSQTVRSYEYSNLTISKSNFNLLGGISFDYQLTSARIISINFDFVTGNNAKISGVDNAELKSKGNSMNITVGLTL